MENNMILEFNINGCRDTDYTYVHIMNNGAKVCVHFPSIRMGERVERFDSYYEAEQYALKFNASRNMIDENDIVLAINVNIISNNSKNDSVKNPPNPLGKIGSPSIFLSIGSFKNINNTGTTISKMIDNWLPINGIFTPSIILTTISKIET